MVAGSSSSSSSPSSSSAPSVVLESETPPFSDGSNGYNMKYAKNRKVPRHPSVSDIPLYLLFICYWHYIIAIIFSYSREALRHYKKWQSNKTCTTKKRTQGYAPLLNAFNTFFEREMYGRIRDVFNRPIASTPGAHVDVLEREGNPLVEPLRVTNRYRRCLNLASYNYLGFAISGEHPTVESFSEKIQEFGVATGSSRAELGTTQVHRKLETMVASFVGKEDAIVYGMGYITNSASLPVLAGRGTLVVSDSLNHASIVVGVRSSGATVKVFKHNNPEHLETVLKKAIVEGQPRTHRPWKKIVIVVEGIYSMEGEILRLPEIVAIKKKYKCYLYVDEAHSIGALGKSGRGVCEYWGVNPDDVDVLMGTFTKSFAAVGGYLAGSKEMVAYLRANAIASIYDTAMTTPLVQQVISVLELLTGHNGATEGIKRIEDLARNVARFRKGLSSLGFEVIGDDDSPVVPVMIYIPTQMPALGRMALEKNVALVMASYPATELLLSRARFCVSAAHSVEDIDRALKTMEELGDLLFLRYHRSQPN